MSTIVKNITGFRAVILVAFALLFLSFFAVFATRTDANVLGDLQSESARLQEEIAANEAYLAELHEYADTLALKIEKLDGEIATETKKIQLTQNIIEELEIKIEETTAELEMQKDVLRHALITLYKEGNITTIELLASSDSYSDFINQQEYLSRIKDQIHDSAKKVEELKLELEDKKETQDEQLLQLEAQRDVLASKKDEQQRILEQTQGEEARYQTIVSELREARAAYEARINAYLASLANNYVSLGPVAAGDVIGGVGNTGVSSGVHLHFEVRSPSLTSPAINPFGVLNSGWTWPLPGGVLTQSYHGGHNAIDIAGMPEGSPVVAAASGNIIHRGCIDVGTVWANFMVIIDHGDGYYTRYAHLVAPNDPAYDGCRATTPPWWF